MSWASYPLPWPWFLHFVWWPQSYGLCPSRLAGSLFPIPISLRLSHSIGWYHKCWLVNWHTAYRQWRRGYFSAQWNPRPYWYKTHYRIWTTLLFCFWGWQMCLLKNGCSCCCTLNCRCGSSNWPPCVCDWQKQTRDDGCHGQASWGSTLFCFLFPVTGDRTAVHIQRVIVKLDMLKKPRVQFNENLVVHWGRKFFKETPEGGSRSNLLSSKYLAQHFINLHHRCVTKTKATNPDAHPKTLYYTTASIRLLILLSGKPSSANFFLVPVWSTNIFISFITPQAVTNLSV